MRPWVAVAATRLAAGRVTGWADGAEAVQGNYLGALRRAGVAPAMIGGHVDMGPGDVGEELAGPWSGLVLCGGADVDPQRYGAVAHPAVYGVDAGRDALEIGLARQAVAAGIPVLAICRGIQVLNVALGGTLVQHLPDRGSVVAHGVPVGLGAAADHPVDVVAGSRLSSVIGGATRIDSCVSIHHQAIERLADGLVVTARSEDGLIEAAELADPARWCLGVQWHPERSAALDETQQAIFDGFAAAARRRVGTG